MWTTYGHLLVGNAIIGVVEGLIIGAVLKRRRVTWVFVMIGANYLSGIAGVFSVTLLADWLFAHVFPWPPLYHFWQVVSIVLAAAFVATIMTEGFVVLGAARLARSPVHKTLLAFLASNVVTYALLVLIYANVSPISLVKRTTIDLAASFIPTDLRARVYFESPRGEVRRVWIDGSGEEPLSESDSLPIERSDDRGSFVHPVADLRSLGPIDSDWWEVRVGFWGSEGVHAQRVSGNGERVWYGMETPLAEWRARDLTAVRFGLVVYCLGEDQIVALDLDSGRIKVIARGHSPSVRLESEP